MGLDEEIRNGRIKVIQEGDLGSRPSWDEYMMHIAIGCASRATCYNVHAGAVAASNNQVLSTGYNGAPSAIEKNCIETGCRKGLKGLDYESSLNSNSCIGIHAEMNAVGHLVKRNSSDLVLYNTIFPCHRCAKDLLPYNLKRFIFKRNYSEKELKSTLDLFEEAGVEVCQLDLSLERDMDIRYNQGDVKFGVWGEDDLKKIKKIGENFKDEKI